jgi:hypothetical protein
MDLQISLLQQIEENVLLLIINSLEHNLFEKKLDQKFALLSKSEKGSVLQSRNSAEKSGEAVEF